MRFPRTFLRLSVIVLLHSGLALASLRTGIPMQFVVSRWGMEEGLPQSSVNDILQSKDGYLWLATHGGLVRFDGVSFTTFNRSNTPGMRSDRILTLFEDRTGVLWIGTEDGFLEFRDGICTPHLIEVNGQIFSPLKVAEDADGRIWISVNSIHYLFNGTKFIPVQYRTDAQSIERAMNDPRGIFLGHDRDIFRTTGDEVVRIADLRSQFSTNIQDVVEFPRGSGTLFIATSGDGVVRWTQSSIAQYRKNQGLPSRYVRKLYIDRDSVLWVNCYNGFSVWSGQAFTVFNGIRGSEGDQFTDVLQDHEGNYWIGTPSRGLFRVRPAVITSIGQKNGLKTDQMLSMTQLRDGTVVLATNCGGIFEWNGDTVRPSLLNAFLPNLCVWSVLQDSKGSLWIGSRVLYRTSSLSERGVMFDSSNGFRGSEIFAMMEDSRGNILIGCLDGLFVYDGKMFRRYGVEDGLSYNDVRVLFEDPEGTVWIGTTAGLNTFRDGKITAVDLIDTSQDSAMPRRPYIRAIHRDSDGVLWLGSYGHGLIRYKEGRAAFITSKQGMFDDIVSHIVEDAHGYFWMGCNRGIYRVQRQDAIDVCDGRRPAVRSFSYGMSDGMPSAETNGGFQPNVLRLSSGELLFPTVSGVAVVNTANVRYNSVPPQVFIEQLFSANEPVPFTSSLTLPYDRAMVEIRYTGLSYTEPGKMQFQFRLEGLDEQWTSAGNRRSAFFTRIPPGEYTFRVIASNNDGVWNETGAAMSIIVTPPFWMTWWFYTIVGLVFAAAGPSVYYFRVTQLQKQNALQEHFARQLIESQEKERQRIAAELHDGIGQQILVIKNRAEMALRFAADPVRTEEQLKEIMQSAVSSIKDIRSISHGLRPVQLEQFGLTESLTALAEQLRESSPIEWSYHIDPIDGLIPKEQEINFYRVLQEATNNILKHSGAKEATVIVRHAEELLSVTVWDDGKGFSVEHSAVSGGMGVSGMQERMKSLGGTLEIISGEEKGTTVRIMIPVKRHG